VILIILSCSRWWQYYWN